METSDVTNPTLIALTALPGGMFWRQNSGTFRTLDGRRFVKASAVGVADIMGCYRGRAVAVETKAKTGRLSTSQQRFRAVWEAAGGLYVVARCAEDAVSAVTAVA